LFYILQINCSIETDIEQTENEEDDPTAKVDFDMDQIHVLSGTYEVKTVLFCITCQ